LMDKPILTNEMYNFVRQEVGSWVYYRLMEQGKKCVTLPKNLIVHIEGMSRPGDPAQKLRVQNFQDEIEALEAEIMAHPEYSKLYTKYKREL